MQGIGILGSWEMVSLDTDSSSVEDSSVAGSFGRTGTAGLVGRLMAAGVDFFDIAEADAVAEQVAGNGILAGVA